MGTMYERIEYLCIQKGIKPGKLCSDTGLSRGMLSDLKMGRTKELSGKSAKIIADYLGVSVDFLMYGKYISEITTFSNGITVLKGNSLSEINYRISSQFEPGTYHVAYRADGVVVIVDNNGGATREQISSVIATFDESKKNAPAMSGKRSVSDDDIMFALWGDAEDMGQDDLDDVKRYAAFVRERKHKK